MMHARCKTHTQPAGGCGGGWGIRVVFARRPLVNKECGGTLPSAMLRINRRPNGTLIMIQNLTLAEANVRVGRMGVGPVWAGFEVGSILAGTHGLLQPRARGLKTTYILHCNSSLFCAQLTSLPLRHTSLSQSRLLPGASWAAFDSRAAVVDSSVRSPGALWEAPRRVLSRATHCLQAASTGAG